MKKVILIAINLMREIFRKKDMYVLITMLLILMIYLANAAFFGMKHIYRYLNEIGLGLVFFFSIIIAVPNAARLMIEEIRGKTIYPLLAKPIRRIHVIAGKFMGSLFVSWSSFALFFLVFTVISVFKQSQGEWLLYSQVFIAGIFMLAVLNAMTICFSVFCTFSTTVTLSYTILFLMSWFGANMRESFYRLPLLGEIAYYILPHFEFFDLRHRLIYNWSPLPLWVMLSICAYAALYTTALLFFALQGFKKRWL
ncbi:MAG: ABC transporter permease subunit [Candidatus Omnitrophica bacterium]|nr:ABC transporter permease subunit [Candidatus Omnitrophota bacterium]